jgi:hypothetical protein
MRSAETKPSLTGLWTAEFGSSLGLYGTGIVVFEAKLVMGGDSGYYYSGSYELRGNLFNAEISVVLYNSAYQSVFGTLSGPEILIIEGIVQDNTITAKGSLKSSSAVGFGVKLTRRG